MTQPWLRQIDVTVGSIPDWKQDPQSSGPPVPVALHVYSDGTQDTLRVRFNIHKHWSGITTPSTVQIYNLSSTLRNSLMAGSGSRRQGTQGAQVILKAGWLNGQLQTLFTGALWGAWNRREGADIVTTLACLSNLPPKMATIQKAYAPLSSLKSVITDIAQNIPGITIDPVLISIDTVRQIGKRGMSISGTAEECLNVLSREFGFSWVVMDGVFEASMDKSDAAFMGSVVQINSKNGTLLRTEPILVSPWQEQAGISIETFLNPAISPRRTIELDSKVNPRLTGSYMAHTVTHTGDTHSSVWDTHVECVFPQVGTQGGNKVRSVDANGMNFIKGLEGSVLNVYYIEGVPHIGVGHKLAGIEWSSKRIRINGVSVNYSGGITQQQSDDLFKQDLARYETAINGSLPSELNLNQNQYNALASITFNVGTSGYTSSSLANTVNSGNYAQVGQSIPTFKTTVNNVYYAPLAVRRQKEATLWNTTNG